MIQRIMNDMNNFNYGREEGLAVTRIKVQQGDPSSMSQTGLGFLGIESQNSPIFSCLWNEN